MNNFFLLNEAIGLDDYEQFKKGIFELNAIEKGNNDTFLKHDSIWDTPIIVKLFSNIGQDESVILKFIEQLSSIEKYICDLNVFNKNYPNTLNAFLGIDFVQTIISTQKQVRNSNDFYNIKRSHYINWECNGNKKLIADCLKELYKNYNFKDVAIDDINYFNQTNILLYKRIHELLLDIEEHPHQGGIGKTEVLKGEGGIASKRINDEHRLTYKLTNDTITIISCRGHYN